MSWRFSSLPRSRSCARRLLRDVSGAAMVEFALVLPLLLTFLLGIVEFGRLWNVRQVLTDATREGARVAVVNNNRLTQTVLQDSVHRTIRRRILNASMDTARLTITANQSTGIGGLPASPATVTVRYDYPLQFAAMAPLFGSSVSQNNTLRLQSTFVMRNE